MRAAFHPCEIEMVPRKIPGGNTVTRYELCEFVELHGKDLYGFCCHLTQNKYDADDLYQETKTGKMRIGKR